MSIFDKMLKAAGNDYAGKVSDGLESDVQAYIDTGSYALNALLSGSIYGGLPLNKVTALAGEESTGKSFLALGVIKQFLADHKDAGVFYFETENAITTKMLEERGIDTKRTYLVPVVTIQEFRTQATKILDMYLEQEASERKPMLMVLDSLGMLSTEKEVSDISEGKDTRDMTRAQLVRGTFRVLTLKLGRAKVPLIVTNHVYEVIGQYVPTQEMGGGGGLKYAASTIVFLSKKKLKGADDVQIGTIIKAKLNKSRLTIENKTVECALDFSKGLDRYYGIMDFAIKQGVIKEVSTKVEFPGGVSAFKSKVNKEPTKYFTPEVLKLIDEAAKKEFCFGTAQQAPEETEGE